MRDAFRNAIVSQIAPDPLSIFLTGDLGYKALEPVSAAFGTRFINAGVAEQNMVSVAAGLAKAGLKPWVYSIAPFLYARTTEQIRNDVCFHDLPVGLVGNGGGFGYGVMGPSHHALEDYGILSTFPNMRIFAPAFDQDLAPIVRRIAADAHPSYLRLGLAEPPADAAIPSYAPVRRLVGTSAGNLLVAVVGAISGSAWTWAKSDGAVELWCFAELPLRPEDLPEAFLEAADKASGLLTIEEHTRQGGFGQALTAHLAEMTRLPKAVKILSGDRRLLDRYGSQKFYRCANGLDADGFAMAAAALRRSAQ